jgi:hypothetical protein
MRVRLLFFLLLSLVLPSVAQATDFHVTPSTFDAAVGSSQGGDTIFLATGSYGTWNGTSKSSNLTIVKDTGASPTMSLDLRPRFAAVHRLRRLSQRCHAQHVYLRDQLSERSEVQRRGRRGEGLWRLRARQIRQSWALPRWYQAAGARFACDARRVAPGDCMESPTRLRRGSPRTAFRPCPDR